MCRQRLCNNYLRPFKLHGIKIASDLTTDLTKLCLCTELDGAINKLFLNSTVSYVRSGDNFSLNYVERPVGTKIENSVVVHAIGT